MDIHTCNKVGWWKSVSLFGRLSTKECNITVSGLTAFVLQLHFPVFGICVSPSSLLLRVPPLLLFFFLFKRCMAQRRWRVSGRSWSGSCPGSWAEGSPTPSPDPTCTLWAPTQRGRAPAWHWYYWFAEREETKIVFHKGSTSFVWVMLGRCVWQEGVVWHFEKYSFYFSCPELDKINSRCNVKDDGGQHFARVTTTCRLLYSLLELLAY